MRYALYAIRLYAILGMQLYFQCGFLNLRFFISLGSRDGCLSLLSYFSMQFVFLVEVSPITKTHFPISYVYLYSIALVFKQPSFDKLPYSVFIMLIDRRFLQALSL